jgi:hypothetical protein
MSWESRKGRGRYYYTARRDAHGRVAKTYVGTGPAAELAAQLDAETRQRRADETATVRAASVTLATLDAAMRDLDAACGLALAAGLATAGYFVYERGGKYIAGGRYRGQAFGETLGDDVVQLLTEIEEGTFLRPSEARQRPLKRGGPTPRLDLRQHCDDHLTETRRLRGKKTAATSLVRLAPALRFADTQTVRRRWPLVQDINREFDVRARLVGELEASVYQRPATRRPPPATGLPEPDRIFIIPGAASAA